MSRSLKQGPRGGSYYELNGKKIYVDPSKQSSREEKLKEFASQESKPPALPKKSEAKLSAIKPRTIGKDAFTAEISAGGKKIGEIRTLEKDGKLMVNEVEIDPEHRGQGHATAVYREAARHAESRGKVLRSDTGRKGPGSSRLSPDAERVWAGFVRRGEARKVESSDGYHWYYEMLPKERK